MDLLNTLLDTGKKIAEEALTKEVTETSERGAETILKLMFETYQTLTAEQIAELMKLMKTLVTAWSDEKPGLDAAWSELQASPLVKEWAGQLFTHLAKRWSTQLLS